MARLAPVLTLLLLRVFQHLFLLGCPTPAYFVATGIIRSNIGYTSALYQRSPAHYSYVFHGKLHFGSCTILSRIPNWLKEVLYGFSTRQFVHERSGLPPPSLHPPPSHSDTLYQMATQLSQRAISFIPSAFRPTHLHFSPPPSLSASCYHDPITFSLRTAEREGSPTFLWSRPYSAYFLP